MLAAWEVVQSYKEDCILGLARHQETSPSLICPEEVS